MIEDNVAKRNIAANLHRLLDDRGWSQSHLSRLTGDPLMTVSRAVRGENLPGVGVLARFAEALDVSIDRLVGPPPRKFSENRRKTA